VVAVRVVIAVRIPDAPVAFSAAGAILFGALLRVGILPYAEEWRHEMHVIVWEFVPKADCEAEFERIYGPGGKWAALFQRAQGFLGTELLRDENRPERYLTVDRWASEAAFRQFRVQFGEPYETLNHECEIMIEQERRIGSFTPILGE